MNHPEREPALCRQPAAVGFSVSQFISSHDGSLFTILQDERIAQYCAANPYRKAEHLQQEGS